MDEMQKDIRDFLKSYLEDEDENDSIDTKNEIIEFVNIDELLEYIQN